MHFMSDIAPITLHTDASDYGVGGYFFQTGDGIDQPVAFVSKSLNKSQLRWSVIQKEAYGVFFSCMYLQSLLRDRFFTIIHHWSFEPNDCTVVHGIVWVQLYTRIHTWCWKWHPRRYVPSLPKKYDWLTARTFWSAYPISNICVKQTKLNSIFKDWQVAQL